MTKIICRLRKYRKSAQLSQLETARLLGLKSQGTFCDIEAGSKRPSARVAIACEVLFGAPIRELFPGLYAQTVRAVQRSAARVQATVGERRIVAHNHFSALAKKVRSSSDV